MQRAEYCVSGVVCDKTIASVWGMHEKMATTRVELEHVLLCIIEEEEEEKTR